MGKMKDLWIEIQENLINEIENNEYDNIWLEDDTKEL
jgi:hypothetical protein